MSGGKNLREAYAINNPDRLILGLATYRMSV